MIQVDKLIETVDRDLENSIVKPRVDIELFKEVFLDAFLHPDGLKSDNLLFAKWTSLVENPRLPVDLVNEYDEVVVTLPPLINGGYVAESNQFEDIGRVVKQAELQNNHIPGTGDRLLEQRFSQAVLQDPTAHYIREILLSLKEDDNSYDNDDSYDYDDEDDYALNKTDSSF